MQTLCSPSAEVYSHRRLHSITKSYDHIKIIMVYLSFYLTRTFLTN